MDTVGLTPHGCPGVLVAICGMDGSGKSTLEEALVDVVAAHHSCTAARVPSQWWRQDARVRRSLFGEGPGANLPDEALMHFNLADFSAYQHDVIRPALEAGDVVVVNRYLFDMLALFEARGIAEPSWLPAAVSHILEPDHCFVLDGSGAVIADRVVRRDGASAGRFDQDAAFIDRYNAALRRFAAANGHVVFSVDDDPGEILRRAVETLGEVVTGGARIDGPALVAATADPA